MFGRKIKIFARGSIIERLNKLREQTLSSFSRKAFAELPLAVMSAVLVGTVIVMSAAGYNLYDRATEKVSQLRMARALADDEAERIRSAGYDDVIKIEKPNGKLSNGYVKEVALGKEYREDIGNSVLKHKPVTINIFDSESSYFPLVSVRTDKVSRWYKSGTFDKSDNGIYDETGEQHNGSLKKTGNGTGYVFLKKGAKVNGEVEIYDETNGDIYISNSIGTPGEKTVIRHVGPATGSGYIRLAESCTINGTVTFENSSNGGLIIETNISDGTHVAKLGSGTGYLKFSKGSTIGNTVKVTNESSGPIVVVGRLADKCHLVRTGSGDGLLYIEGTISGLNGPQNITMEDSGSIFLYQTLRGTNVKYRSTTGQRLNLYCNKLSGNVAFVNDSYGYITMTGTMADGAQLNISGNGAGYFYMDTLGKITGTVSVINDTDGCISYNTVFPEGKILKKIGGGSGSLTIGALVKIEGDLTYDCDGIGAFTMWSNWDTLLNMYRCPRLVDGSYIYFYGKPTKGGRLFRGVEVLGRINIDASQHPNIYFSEGTYMNNPDKEVNRILQDGYKTIL